MATAVLNPVAIPGLHTAPSREDLEKATLSYNLLPDDQDQPEISPACLKDMTEMIMSHNVQEKFGIHLVHGHLQIDQSKIILDVGTMHGHVFALSPDGEFEAYEYHQGPPPTMGINDDAFVVALKAYLRKHGLESLIGLQFLNEQNDKQLQEFVLDDNNGTVMLDAEDTNITQHNRVTGNVSETNESVPKLKDTEKHAPTIKNTHRVFTDSSQLSDEKSLMKVLRAEGIID